MSKVKSTSYIDFKNSTFNRTRIQSVYPHKKDYKFMFTVRMYSNNETTFTYLDEVERDDDYKLFNELRGEYLL